jgi:hypothetical protein
MDATMIAAACGLALVSGVASWHMALGKSRRVWLWTAIGVLFNLPGMLLLVVMPVRAAARPAAVTDLHKPDEPPRRLAA